VVNLYGHRQVIHIFPQQKQCTPKKGDASRCSARTVLSHCALSGLQSFQESTSRTRQGTSKYLGQRETKSSPLQREEGLSLLDAMPSIYKRGIFSFIEGHCVFHPRADNLIAPAFMGLRIKLCGNTVSGEPFIKVN
jgi:hypothetical protein